MEDNKLITYAEALALIDQAIEESSKLPNTSGVYIVDSNKEFHTIETWDPSTMTASGVGIIDPSGKIIVAPEYQVHYWSYRFDVISGCTIVNSSTAALTDYATKANTDAIVNTIGNLDYGYEYAARYCRDYVFAHGELGSLPAAGHLALIEKYFTPINNALSVINASEQSGGPHWSSTQYSVSDGRAFSIVMTSGAPYTVISDTLKASKYPVRPICVVE